MGRKHTFVNRWVRETFRCKACGWSGVGRALGVGEGVGISPLGLDDAGADRRAEAQAASAAERNARVALSIAPCPRCDVRDPVAVKAFERKAALMVLAMFAAGLAVGGLVGLVTSWRYGAIIGFLAALGGVYIENLKKKATWNRAATDAEFEER